MKTRAQLQQELDEALDKAERLVECGKKQQARTWLPKIERLIEEVKAAK
jgi:hypothetical protein